MERAALLTNRSQRAKAATLFTEETDMQVLEQLAEAVLAANRESMLALESAHHTMRETLAVLQAGKSRHGCQ